MHCSILIPWLGEESRYRTLVHDSSLCSFVTRRINKNEETALKCPAPKWPSPMHKSLQSVTTAAPRYTFSMREDFRALPAAKENIDDGNYNIIHHPQSVTSYTNL